jgi:hypothetical protein
MHTGMLWFDNSTNVSLSGKVQSAIAYYRKKYHRDPNLCLVHPSVLADGDLQLGITTVRGYRPVLPGHLWIGMEEQE